MKQILNKIIILVIAYLITSSVYFTAWLYQNNRSLIQKEFFALIEKGDKVSVLSIKDGDELIVEKNGYKHTIRIIGIKSLEPFRNEPNIADVSRLAYHYLENNIKNKEVIMKFSLKKEDSRGRILSYVYIGDLDIGRAMLEEGLTMAYTEFPFEKQDEYIKYENEAMKKRKGIWTNPVVLKRGVHLKKIWEIKNKS